MRLFLALCMLATLAAASVHAQPALLRGGTPPLDPESVVTWTVPSDPVRLAPGAGGRLRVRAEIEPGWHVYALDSPLGRPLSVDVSGLPAGVRAGPPRQSAPVEATDPALGGPVRWFEGTATVDVPLTAPHGTGAGEHGLDVAVTFMACDDRVCLPPRTVHLDARLVVEAAAPVASAPVASETTAPAERPAPTSETASAADTVAADVRAPVAEAAEASAAPAPPLRGGGGSGLGGFLLLAVGAGLAALLTPCVFPLVPLTVGAFSHGAGTRRATVGRALGFGLAVVAVFTALGGAASAALGAAGAQRVAASPWVNLALGVAFVVFALALLGLVDLRLPSRWTNAVDGASRRRGGVAGTLLAALALAVVSFSCTAPFVGGLLATAATGGWARPLLGMAAFSAAFALPFVALAAAPGLAARLPRSGPWMATLKGTLGFVELAAAVKFLSNADLVWGVGLLTRPVVVALTMAVAGLATLFLLGRLRLAGADGPTARLGAGRLLGAVGTFSALLVLAPGLTGGPVPLADAYLPPRETTADGLEGGLAWHTDDFDAARAEAAVTAAPLFVDFTGYTCTNCRAMEATVFPAPEVAALLGGDVVRARLYTDARPHGPAYQDLQRELTGTVAMPTYAVLSPAGDVVGVWSGMASPDEFAAFLRSALAGA